MKKTMLAAAILGVATVAGAAETVQPVPYHPGLAPLVAAPVAPTEEQIKALAEQQSQAMQAALEQQRGLAEQYARYEAERVQAWAELHQQPWQDMAEMEREREAFARDFRAERSLPVDDAARAARFEQRRADSARRAEEQRARMEAARKRSDEQFVKAQRAFQPPPFLFPGLPPVGTL
jgi:hypothetical protein